MQSGGDDDRPQLRAAMEQCRRTGAELLVAKLDRLSRKVSFIAQLMDDPKLRLRVATMPQADKFQLHIYAALAEQENRLATELQARIRASQADLAARMDPMARSVRIVEIRSELQVLDYAPWGVRTSRRRADLGIELRLLETTAAASQSLAA